MWLIFLYEKIALKIDSWIFVSNMQANKPGFLQVLRVA